VGDLHTSGARAAFRDEVRRATRATALAGGVIALAAFPAWGIFDHLVDPAHAAGFTTLRLWLELPLALLWLSLFTGPGQRHPEVVMLLFLAIVQLAVAYMIVRVDGAEEPYALGMSLALYASSYLLIWPWTYTAALIGATWLALGAMFATAPAPLDKATLGTIGFYLGTASLVAFVGQLHRQVSAWQEFRSRAELEIEQARSRQLLGRLERLSLEDGLTGVANRRCWDETLAREFERTRRHGGELAVMLCDVDRLKEVNDGFGHATGDRVLQVAAGALRERVRASDLVARLGGDEFGILCPDTDLGSADTLAEDVRRRLRELEAIAPGVPELTLSIGVAALTESDQSPNELVGRADDCLYRAKQPRAAVRVSAYSRLPAER